MTAELGEFEGKDVIQVGVKFSGGATGLNEAMSMRPEVHHQGEEVYLIVRGKTKIGFEDVKDTDCLKRVENVVIKSAVYIDATLATEKLEAQELMIEEAKGIARLALEPNQPLIEAHQRHEHDDAREFGCPICDEEELAEQEQREEAERAEQGKAGPAPRTPSGRKSRAKPKP